LPGISGHNGVELEVEWDEICRESNVEKIVSLYYKMGILGLQSFLWEKVNLWPGIGSCVEEIWKHNMHIISRVSNVM
jgi:hypothetical protein